MAKDVGQHRTLYRSEIKTGNGKNIPETTTKISNMTKTESIDTINNNTKHTGVENYTNIQITHDEIQL
jgi:hypothetical protein